MGDYLTMNEKTKYDTIKAVVNERKTIERAQVELRLSRKQIKRLFNTFQDRLINEMRLVHITTIEQANTFLVDYIPQYNQQFALEIQDTMNIFEKPLSVESLNTILARFDYWVNELVCSIQLRIYRAILLVNKILRNEAYHS